MSMPLKYISESNVRCVSSESSVQVSCRHSCFQNHTRVPFRVDVWRMQQWTSYCWPHFKKHVSGVMFVPFRDVIFVQFLPQFLVNI